MIYGSGSRSETAEALCELFHVRGGCSVQRPRLGAQALYPRPWSLNPETVKPENSMPESHES